MRGPSVPYGDAMYSYRAVGIEPTFPGINRNADRRVPVTLLREVSLTAYPCDFTRLYCDVRY